MTNVHLNPDQTLFKTKQFISLVCRELLTRIELIGTWEGTLAMKKDLQTIVKSPIALSIDFTHIILNEVNELNTKYHFDLITPYYGILSKDGITQEFSLNLERPTKDAMNLGLIDFSQRYDFVLHRNKE